MISINKCIFSGRLGKKPEIKFTKHGTAAMSLDICVVDRVKDGDQWKDKISWVKAVIYGKRAEFFSYLDKGSLVMIESRLQTGQYEDKSGRTVHVTEYIADHVVADKPIDAMSGGFNQKPIPEQFNPSTTIEDDLPF